MLFFRYFLLISFLSACTFGVPIQRHTTDAAAQKSSGSQTKKSKSYIVGGKQYYIMDSADGYVKRGVASWYGKKFHGRKTANGEIYDMFAMTAAHKTLPLPTKVSVKNLSNGKTIIVRVNDRGPFVGTRIIDLSYTAAKKLDMIANGTALVEVRALTKNNSAPAIRAIPLKTEASASSDIFIQIGSFSQSINAEALLTQLKQSGFSDGRVYPINTNKGNFYRVRLGPYIQLEKAQQLVKNLHAKSFDRARLVVEN
ncbi:MAG: septal ring lytic transglycosylase RlpA family protein [Gammaproteobacteria bacterium]|nr:septal ring lytic transglycosylase RlpA family protein [Gammaproteobacteria bacterium]